MMRGAFPLLLAASLLVGCASTNLQPITSNTYQQLPDEKRVWMLSEEEQERLSKSEMIFDDPELTAYLNKIALKVLPEEARNKIDIEVIVLSNPYSNAFAFPNGKVYVHTGILARMENEAQLATLLGHEMTHTTHRHQVRERRSIRNKSAGMASFRATFGSLPLLGELSSALGELGTMAAVSGYSKALETEADNEGLKWMLAAGYDAREAPKLFKHLMAEMEEEGTDEPFFFGSHPKLKARHTNYQSFLKSSPHSHGGAINKNTFERAIAPAVYETARLDLKAGRFEKAEKGVQRYLKTYPKNSKAHFLLGEVYRQRNGEGDYEKAVKHLSQASQLNHRYAEPSRSLGLIYLNTRNKTAALKAFRTYLGLAPKAEDRGFIQEYIRQLK